MLKIWKTRTVTLKGKIVIIKAIAISKIIFQSFITTVPIILGKNLNKYWYLFSGKTLILRQNMKLSVTNIKLEGKAKKCWSSKKNYCSSMLLDNDNSFHELELIPLYLIEKSFGASFKFHSNFLFKTNNKTKFFLHLSIGKFCWTGKNFLLWWLKYLLVFYLNICGTMKVSRWINNVLF